VSCPASVTQWFLRPLFKATLDHTTFCGLAFNISSAQCGSTPSSYGKMGNPNLRLQKVQQPQVTLVSEETPCSNYVTILCGIVTSILKRVITLFIHFLQDQEGILQIQYHQKKAQTNKLIHQHSLDNRGMKRSLRWFLVKKQEFVCLRTVNFLAISYFLCQRTA
jgi:hypothetical protein